MEYSSLSAFRSQNFFCPDSDYGTNHDQSPQLSVTVQVVSFPLSLKQTFWTEQLYALFGYFFLLREIKLISDGFYEILKTVSKNCFSLTYPAIQDAVKLLDQDKLSEP